MRDIDPSDVGKHFKIIKAAQTEMLNSDILICGKCRSVFHFIEQFKEHKGNNCEKDSLFKDCRDTKPKLWAFLLWKCSQLNNNLSNNHVNSWDLYQQWIRMDEATRDTWITAGTTILSFNKLGQGVLQEMPVKITKTVIDSPPSKNVVQTSPQINKITTSRLNAAENKNPIIQQIIVKKDSISSKDDSDDTTIRTVTTETPKITRKPVVTPIIQNTIDKPSIGLSNIIVAKNINRRANRTTINKNGQQEFIEEIVEKIIAKRYNPRRKSHEYLVKWEGFTHDKNTWEPQTHLECCPQLLETFEKQLARQKEQKAKQEAVKQQQQQQQQQHQQQQQQQAQISVSNNAVISPSNSVINRINKPLTMTANLKTVKSVEQQKKLTENEEPTAVLMTSNVAVKRKREESDFENEFDDDEIPVHTVKKLKNGSTTISLKSEPKNETKIISPQPVQQQQTKTIIRSINGTTKSSPVSNANDQYPNVSMNVVVTKDPNQTSGIFKKSGLVPIASNKTEAQIHLVSKGENTTSGILRINNYNSPQQQQQQQHHQQQQQQQQQQHHHHQQQLNYTATSISSVNIESKSPVFDVVNTTSSPISTTGRTLTKSPGQRLGGVALNTTATNSAQISQVQTHRIVMTPKETHVTKTPVTSVSKAAQKTIAAPIPPEQYQVSSRTAVSRTPASQMSISPSSVPNKLLTSKNARNMQSTKMNSPPAITPEQKIIQLSKSGDLKVTRKVITQPISQPISQPSLPPAPPPQLSQPQHTISVPAQAPTLVQTQQRQITQVQHQQHQQHQQQQQPQQHIPIPQPQRQSRTLSITKSEPDHSQSPMSSVELFNESQNSPGQFTLCEITGNVLRAGEESDRKIQEISESHMEKQQQPNEMMQTQMVAETFSTGDLALAEDGTHQYLTNNDGTPLLITGDDGIIYQVAGKNAEGQTILIAQGPDGEQQYAYISAEDTEEGVLGLDNTVAEAMAQMLPKQQAEELGAVGPETQFIIKQTEDNSVEPGNAAISRLTTEATDNVSQALAIQTGGDTGESQDSNYAEIVQADLPSPGGTRRVVLLLRDGTFVMTEMKDEEYQAAQL